ncbi:hypothetical protein Nmel_002948, partial [Mimus melanotis]
IWATVHTRKKGQDAIAHWHSVFPALRIPCTIKTNNSPAYISQKTRHFLQLLDVSHHTSIPRLTTGQAILEHAPGTLKRILEKQKGGMCGESPLSRIAKTIYTLNHLRLLEKCQNPVFLNHFLLLAIQSPKSKVMVRDLITNRWEGPWNLITWGHEYACASTDTRTCWILARCVRPALRPARDHRQQPPDGPSTD